MNGKPLADIEPLGSAGDGERGCDGSRGAGRVSDAAGCTSNDAGRVADAAGRTALLFFWFLLRLLAPYAELGECCIVGQVE